MATTVREQSNWEHSAKFMTVCAHRINPGNCVRFLMLVKSTENDSLMIDMRRSCRCGYDSTDRESEAEAESEPEPEPEAGAQCGFCVGFEKGSGAHDAGERFK